MFSVDLLQPSISLSLCLIPLLCFFFTSLKLVTFKNSHNKNNPNAPRSYPLIGSLFTIIANKHRRIQWTSDIVLSSPSLTFTLHRPLGHHHIVTANPKVVEHILKTKFDIYQKGLIIRSSLSEFLGDGIFNTNGESWKFQRQISGHEFNTKSLCKFLEVVVDTEISQRLIPILTSASLNGNVVDFQDILQRLAFDNVCKIAFGYDAACLLPSLPESQFAVAFEDATRLSIDRVNESFPIIWKIKRILNIGSERNLKDSVDLVRDYAKKVIKEKKQELEEKSSINSVDILSRFLCLGISEDLVTDIIISFILAGRDSTSAALTWFFWLISCHPEIEKNVVMEIREKSEAPVYEEVKDMIYLHASLCESMRLYPPVPVDTKEAVENDVLPDGTFMKKGDRVTYHPYAMGRAEKIWGSDWAEFRPERWLEREEAGNWRFVARDAYTYPVFQAGPRICLGKDMAFLQMKRVVAGVLRQFKVVDAMDQGVEPVYVSPLTSKMEGGFPVRILKREAEAGNR